MRIRLMMLGAMLVSSSAAWAQQVDPQLPRFAVFEKIQPCMDTRQDWFTVSEGYPGTPSTNVWKQVTSLSTFAAAAASADAGKLQDKTLPFHNRACLDWSVFKSNITGALSVGRNPQPIGHDNLQWVAGPMSCEDAFNRAGLPVGTRQDCRNVTLSTGVIMTKTAAGPFVPFTAPSLPPPPPPPGRRGLPPIPIAPMPSLPPDPKTGCFGNDAGMASTDGNAQASWAAGQTDATIQANLLLKIDRLFNCDAVSQEQLANAFANMSMTIASDVQNVACFGGDAGAISLDWQRHYNWAMSQNYAAVRQNMETKVRDALKCVDRAKQVDIFANLSVSVAKTPGSPGGPHPPPVHPGVVPPPPPPRIVPPPPPPPPQQTGNWSGTWIDGISVVKISGSGNSLSATWTYKDTNLNGSGSWSACKVEGNTAKCNWTVAHEDDTKAGTRKGTLEATLNGTTIAGSYYEDAPQWSYKPGYSASNVTSSMYKGAVHPMNLKRSGAAPPSAPAALRSRDRIAVSQPVSENAPVSLKQYCAASSLRSTSACDLASWAARPSRRSGSG